MVILGFFLIVKIVVWNAMFDIGFKALEKSTIFLDIYYCMGSRVETNSCHSSDLKTWEERLKG